MEEPFAYNRDEVPMCVHIFKRYLHQTWNFVLRSFILMTLAFLAFSGQARMPGAKARSDEESDAAYLQTDKNRSWL